MLARSPLLAIAKLNTMTNKITDRRDVGTFIPSCLDDFGLNVYEYRIYCRIVRRAGTRQGCFEAAKKMSESLGIDKKTVYKSLKTLTDHGLIEKQLVKGKATHYYLTPPEEWIPINRTTRPDPKTGQPDLTLKRVNGQPLKGSTPEPLTGQHLTLERVTKVIPVIESIENNPMKKGNPPKPACSLDPVDAFASSVIPDVSPSPHPGCADRRSDNPASEDCSQGQEVTQENSKQAELSVDNACGQPVDGGNNFFPGPPEVLLKQDKILGVDSSVSFSEQGISQEFNADNCQSEVKSQTYQNTEVEEPDVFNASARCDRQFNRLMPSMELSQVDRQWLKADGGQRLLTRMKSMGIELTRWWEVLDYWHKEHQLWAWRNQEGFSAKTDLEKRRRIKEAFAGWSKKPDNTNTLDEDLECFLSRLRRANDGDRTKQQVRREEDPTRRPRTEEELAEIIAIFQANKPTW